MAFCCCGRRSAADVIAKNAVQLRGLEALGLAREPSPRLRRTEVQIPVTINVYSLLESNKKLTKMGMGVFHAGVVVYGIEWGYGEVVDNPNASGLFCVHPGQAAGTLYRTIRIGYTTRSPMQVDTILHRLENEWRSSDYHILHHNCNHFAQAFCDLLTTTEKLQVPSWCNRAARVGDRVIPRRLATKVQRMMDDEPPKAVAPTPRSNVNEVPVSVVPHEWYLHPSIFQPLRYIGESRPIPIGTRDRNTGQPSQGGGGGSHYSVEYDIVPAPGYDATEPGSAYPPIRRREMFCSTDENGSITHIVAIEEQPSLPASSSRDSARKTAAPRAGATRPAPGESPPPPPHGLTFASGGDDRVQLPRVVMSAIQPNTIAATGTPQASEADGDFEDVVRTAMSEDLPLPAHALGAVASRSCGSSVSAARRGSGGAEVLPHRKALSRDDSAGGFTDKPLYTMRETSALTNSLEVSATSLGGLRPPPPPSFFATSQAVPVGCITSLPPASPRSPGKEAAQSSTGAPSAGAEQEDSRDAANRTPTEVSHNASGVDVAALAMPKRSKPASAVKSGRAQKGKDAHEFSDIAGDAQPVSARRRSSTTWCSILKSAVPHRSSSGSGATGSAGKAVRKYLTTPPPSDEASSMGDASPGVDAVSMSSASSTTSSAASPFPRASPRESLQKRREARLAGVALASRRERDDTHVFHSAFPSAGPSSRPPTPPRVPERDYHHNHHSSDARAERAEDDHAADDRSSAAPELLNTLRMPAIGTCDPRRSPGCQAAPAPPSHWPAAFANGADAAAANAELHTRRLSHSDILSGIATPLPPVSGPDANFAAAPATTVVDSPAPRFSGFVVTPERPGVAMSSGGGATTGCSPATAHRQCRRGSASAAMSDTPPSNVERCRTPIPLAWTRRGNDESAAPALRLELGSESAEQPARRTSSRLSHTAGDLGTPLAAHTPMAPFPRRPSLHCRDRGPHSSGAKSGANLSRDHSAGNLSAQRSLNAELEHPPRLSLSASLPTLEDK